MMMSSGNRHETDARVGGCRALPQPFGPKALKGRLRGRGIFRKRRAPILQPAGEGSSGSDGVATVNPILAFRKPFKLVGGLRQSGDEFVNARGETVGALEQHMMMSCGNRHEADARVGVCRALGRLGRHDAAALAPHEQ